MATIPIVNFDRLVYSSSKKLNKHGNLFPSNVRAIIAGPSASGKSNLCFNLIFAKNALKFKHLYVFSKSLYQDKYRLLKQIFSKIKCVTFHTSDDIESILHPNDLEPHSLVIFDDIQLSNNSNIKHYFSMGRHRNVDTVYIIQSVAACKKHFVRENCNLLIFFPLDNLSLKLIYRDFCASDFRSFEEFRKMCSKIWNENNSKHNCISIFTEFPASNGKYRRGLDSFIDITQFSNISV